MHKNKKYTFLILVISFIFTSTIVEGSDKNKLRHKAWQDVNSSYKKCKKTLENYNYWKIVTGCVENIKDKEKMYLCHEKASFNYLEGGDKLNCLRLKPSTDDFIQRVKELKAQPNSTKKDVN